MTKRVFSGIQPTGSIHIGNYLGAMQHWAARQNEFDNIFCIVDLHSITIPQEATELRAKTRELAAILLAVGIDPQKSAIFVQSHIKEHAELTWILNCFTPIGWLFRMTQYKDKSEKQEIVSTGLLDYPVLMTSDIILYDAHYVPVGEDQKQHVELARDIAQRFNSLYGEVFVVPGTDKIFTLNRGVIVRLYTPGQIDDLLEQAGLVLVEQLGREGTMFLCSAGSADEAVRHR